MKPNNALMIERQQIILDFKSTPRLDDRHAEQSLQPAIRRRRWVSLCRRTKWGWRERGLWDVRECGWVCVLGQVA